MQQLCRTGAAGRVDALQEVRLLVCIEPLEARLGAEPGLLATNEGVRQAPYALDGLVERELTLAVPGQARGSRWR